jgi:hypothetical protein
MVKPGLVSALPQSTPWTPWTQTRRHWPDSNVKPLRLTTHSNIPRSAPARR